MKRRTFDIDMYFFSQTLTIPKNIERLIEKLISKLSYKFIFLKKKNYMSHTYIKL